MIHGDFLEFGASHGLADAEIDHDLLGTTGDGVGSDFSVQALNLLSLSASRVCESTEDLRSLSGAELEDLRALGLEQRRGSSQSLCLFSLVHGAHLVGDVFDPSLCGLNLACHLTHLEADDGVVDESLSERLTLVRVPDGFLETNT